MTEQIDDTILMVLKLIGSGLRVLLKWKIYRPDSMVADVITPRAPS